MRLWSISPAYLDSKGLVAVWREALLAKHVLEGKTVGYKNHPQLIRFKESSNPLLAINIFLTELFNEAQSRGYKFNKEKIGRIDKSKSIKIFVSKGQIEYEFKLLLYKLKERDHQRYLKLNNLNRISCNGLFTAKRGTIEKWEKVIKKIAQDGK